MYKINAQSLRLFDLYRDVNYAHRASANLLQNKNVTASTLCQGLAGWNPGYIPSTL